MPALEKIVVQNFRNIELQELEFCANVNCILGGNGEGKTNLLDAIHYLSVTKSAIVQNDKYAIRHGEQEFAICGTYALESGISAKISLRANSKGEKKVLRDEKAYKRFSDHIGLLPVVMVSPADSALVSDSSEERRRFVNSVLSQTDREFLSDIQRYNRILAQRNALLKEDFPDAGVLETLGASMAPYAARIHQVRKKFAADLEPLVQQCYEVLSSGREKVGITYRSDLDKGQLENILAENAERDRALHYTLAGIHRDDFVFTMDGEPIRRVGSQGQQKTFLVSLKFAQYALMKERYGFAPLLLLDDLFDKLDPERTANMLKMVAGRDFGQIFQTDCNKARISAIMSGITQECEFFEARGGAFTK